MALAAPCVCASTASGLVIIPKVSSTSAASDGCAYGLIEAASRNCVWIVLYASS